MENFRLIIHCTDWTRRLDLEIVTGIKFIPRECKIKFAIITGLKSIKIHYYSYDLFLILLEYILLFIFYHAWNNFIDKNILQEKEIYWNNCYGIFNLIGRKLATARFFIATGRAFACNSMPVIRR